MSNAADIAAPYLSHLPLLLAAFNVTSGPVLELGSGLGSTWLLHGLCGSTGRKLTTLETDEKWLLRFLNYGRKWHEIRLVENYIDLPEYKQKWGLAFVDHGLYEQRGTSIVSLKHVPIIIVHDTCYPWLYGYMAAFKHFRYVWHWRVFGPQTSAVSNTIDVREIFGGFGL